MSRYDSVSSKWRGISLVGLTFLQGCSEQKWLLVDGKLSPDLDFCPSQIERSIRDSFHAIRLADLRSFCFFLAGRAWLAVVERRGVAEYGGV